MNLNKAYRIYVGARNTQNHTFTTRDSDILQSIVSQYFSGWTIVESIGYWDGSVESSRIITVFTSSSTGYSKSPVEACASQLRGNLKQYAVAVEEGGLVSIY